MHLRLSYLLFIYLEVWYEKKKNYSKIGRPNFVTLVTTY